MNGQCIYLHLFAQDLNSAYDARTKPCHLIQHVLFVCLDHTRSLGEKARAGVSGVYELVRPTATHLLAVAVSRLAAVSEEWLEVAQRCDGWIPQPPNDSSSRVVAEEEDV